MLQLLIVAPQVDIKKQFANSLSYSHEVRQSVTSKAKQTKAKRRARECRPMVKTCHFLALLCFARNPLTHFVIQFQVLRSRRFQDGIHRSLPGADTAVVALAVAATACFRAFQIFSPRRPYFPPRHPHFSPGYPYDPQRHSYYPPPHPYCQALPRVGAAAAAARIAVPAHTAAAAARARYTMLIT